MYRGMAVLALVVSACTEQAPTAPDAATTSAPDYYGLQVGARWTYLRSGDVLRWKEITACEEVLLLDVDTGEA